MYPRYRPRLARLSECVKRDLKEGRTRAFENKESEAKTVHEQRIQRQEDGASQKGRPSGSGEGKFRDGAARGGEGGDQCRVQQSGRKLGKQLAEKSTTVQHDEFASALHTRLAIALPSPLGTVPRVGTYEHILTLWCATGQSNNRNVERFASAKSRTTTAPSLRSLPHTLLRERRTAFFSRSTFRFFKFYFYFSIFISGDIIDL